MARRFTSIMIALTPQTADVVCVSALRQQRSVHQFAGTIVERVIRQYFELTPQERTTLHTRPSTLAALLQAPSSTGLPGLRG